MKTIHLTSILSFLIFSSALFAADAPAPQELIYQRDKKISEKIQIKILNKMKVNVGCFVMAKQCTEFINKKAVPEKNKTGLKGNPASLHCSAIGGESIILKDVKNNEYDYCRFQGMYMVDSWDLYESSKK